MCGSRDVRYHLYSIVKDAVEKDHGQKNTPTLIVMCTILSTIQTSTSFYLPRCMRGTLLLFMYPKLFTLCFSFTHTLTHTHHWQEATNKLLA